MDNMKDNWKAGEPSPAGEAGLADERLMALLDEWQAPEVSPWFETRMAARLRAEMAAPQAKGLAGVYARWRDRMLFGNGGAMRPVLAGSMALVLLAGGGYFGISNLHTHERPAVSATVQDLQVLDNNEQALQQMDQLLDGTADDQPQS